MLTLNVIKPERLIDINRHYPMFLTINNGSSPRKISKYTLEIFLNRAHTIHGNKYNYDDVKPEHIENSRSKVPIKCNTCRHKWECSINNHINGKRECPSCAGVLPWKYDRFMSNALVIHGDKFNYSRIIPEYIKNKESIILIECKTCGYCFETTVDRHIVRKRGCPSCSKRLPWTYERFIDDALEIHGNKINYSKVTLNTICDGHKSRVTLICNTCYYEWITSIDSHIRRKHGCPNCASNAPWTYERLLDRFSQVHGKIYNYSKITNNHILGCRSKIPIICNTCGCEWECSIDSHVNGKGCPSCNKSKGEIKCANYLQSIGIHLEPQGRINSIPTKRYDFNFFFHLNKWFLLEFDGIQHFKFINYFNRNIDDFVQGQQIDILKTKMAIQEGYTIIRIDYYNLSKIEFHLNKALMSNSNVYFSDENKYKYIIENI